MSHYKLILVLLMPFAAFASEEKKVYRDSGSLLETIEMHDGDKHGWHRTYYANGELKNEVPYKKGKRHGTGRLFNYINGQTVREIDYVEGQIHGFITTYYPDIQAIRYQAEYKNGQKHGNERAYARPVGDNTEEVGVLHYERSYKHGEKHGWERKYFDSLGSSITLSINGLDSRTGRQEDGLISEIFFENGKRQGASWKYYLEGCTREEYLDDQLHGKVKAYWRERNGGACTSTLGKLVPYRQGERHGESHTFDREGQLTEVERYQYGELHGLTEKFSNGKLTQKIPYQDGVRHGVMEGYFDYAGRLSLLTHYEHGEKHGIEERANYDHHSYRLSRVKYVHGKRQGEMHTYSIDRTTNLLSRLSDEEIRQFNYEAHASLTSVVTFVDDQTHGTRTDFFENGELKEHSNYHQGEYHGEMVRYSKYGHLVERTHYVDGEYHGRREEYDYRNGSPKSITHHDNGVLHGEKTVFSSEAPVISWKANYAQGEKVGLYQRFDRNTGRLLVERDLDNGISRYFYSDGTLEAEIHRQGDLVVSGERFDRQGNKLQSGEKDFEKYR
ncbi:toxin-antitoxin system YwqK family antitoxin [Vibrio sp. WXL103]|uniref:toxin-antitoxin system YwqK family antitoxin n=1 Tax=Vibrio sp. WXL103 TaxID=3450710 RepID=UPI003EC55BCE